MSRYTIGGVFNPAYHDNETLESDRRLVRNTSSLMCQYVLLVCKDAVYKNKRVNRMCKIPGGSGICTCRLPVLYILFIIFNDVIRLLIIMPSYSLCVVRWTSRKTHHTNPYARGDLAWPGDSVGFLPRHGPTSSDDAVGTRPWQGREEDGRRKEGIPIGPLNFIGSSSNICKQNNTFI